MAGTALDQQTSVLPRAVIGPRPRTRRVSIILVIRFGILTVASISGPSVAWMLFHRRSSPRCRSSPTRRDGSRIPQPLHAGSIYDVSSSPRGDRLLQSFTNSILVATIGTFLS